MRICIPIAILSFAVAVGFGESRLFAVPTDYSITILDESIGTGTFTIDVGAPLDDYAATEVLGGGATFGTWDALHFVAEAGQFPSLVISNLVGASYELFVPGIGGGSVQSGSQADLEWDNFISGAATAGVHITPVTTTVTTSVPEGGPSAVLTALVLGGLCLVARVRRVRPVVAGPATPGSRGTWCRRTQQLPGRG